MSPKKRSYDKMYEPKEEIQEEVVTPVVEPPIVEVTPEGPKKKKFKFGKVVGGSLNVRKAPDADIVNVLKDGENVTIESEDGDWYEISVPYAGYVMKKFIEV